MAVKMYVWLDVEEETNASNSRIGCNFKQFRSHKFMTSVKIDHSYDPRPLYLQKWTIIFCLKAKKSTNTWQILRHPLFPCNVINVSSLTCLLWYELFFCLKKLSFFCLNETRQSQKYCSKTLLSYKDGNGILRIWCDRMPLMFIIPRINPISIQVFAFSEVSDLPYIVIIMETVELKLSN